MEKGSELDIITENLISTLNETLGIGKTAFHLWFDGLTLISLDSNRAVFTTPSKLKCDVLVSRYIDGIASALSELIGFEVKVEIYSLEEKNKNEKGQDNENSTLPHIYKSSKEELSYENELEQQRRDMGQHLLSDDDIEDLFKPSFKESSNYSYSQDNGADSLSGEEYTPKITKSTLSTYTFDNFVEGDSNRFAKAACMGVVEEPGFSYNPLFIYGNSGLGKTHLLYATINDMKKKHPELKIVYKKCESFVNELVLAIRQSATDVFKERYRSCDVLLIDDIQFIAGKELCQEEFFHTFSSLYEADKQIILTSDRRPSEIEHLADRLRSRFESGLIADIKVPGFELRAAITRKKADKLGLNISTELIYHIAQRLRVNIRQIEGVLKKIHMLCGLTGKEVTHEVVEEAIFSVDPGNMPNETLINRTLVQVSKKYGVSIEDLKSKKRTDSIAKARHIAIYLIKEIIEEISLTDLGSIFGRDHSTVHSSLKKVDLDIRTVDGVEEDIKKLISEIKGV